LSTNKFIPSCPLLYYIFFFFCGWDLGAGSILTASKRKVSSAVVLFHR
jgi:hypothetical protein